jgi:hypothetical protein
LLLDSEKWNRQPCSQRKRQAIVKKVCKMGDLRLINPLEKTKAATN